MMCVYVTCDVVPNATLMHVLISYDELTFQRLHVWTPTYYLTSVRDLHDVCVRDL